jgi:hypothetical protein
MFLKIVKFTLFVIVNLFGWFTVPFIYTSALKFGLVPHPNEPLIQDQMYTAFTMYQPLSALAAIASIGFFFTRGELRAWLILAPLYVPALYGFGVLAYFYIV